MAIGIKAHYVILVPTTPGAVPNGSLFLDSSNGDQFTTKETGGSTSTVSTGASVSNMFVKQMQADGVFPAKAPLSKKSNGRVIAGDSDGVSGQSFIGYSMDASTGAGDLVQVLCIGANLASAITGLGFTPGDDVFLSEVGGYTNDPNSFTGDNDSIIKVGVADCAAGAASGTAVDLIAYSEIVVRP